LQDPRIEQLADILINHSVAVQPGETVLISSNELARPMVEAIYKKVLVKGAFPVLKITFSTLAPLYYQHASGEQLDTKTKKMNPIVPETILFSIGNIYLCQ